MLWGVVTGFVVFGAIAGFQFLSHFGRSPAARLPPSRFGVTLGVALLLPVVALLGLPVEFSDFTAPAGGVGTPFGVLVFSSAVGLLFGSVEMILYAVMSGLPRGRTTV